MNKRVLASVSMLLILPLSTAMAEEPEPTIFPNQPLVMVFIGGDWTWVRNVQRKGPMFNYFEISGRHIQTERFVSIPVQRVDADASTAVNTVFARFGAACEAGAARDFQFELDQRLTRIFKEAAQRAVFESEDGRRITDCFRQVELGEVFRKAQAEAARRPTVDNHKTPQMEYEQALAKWKAEEALEEQEAAAAQPVDEFVDPYDLEVLETYRIFGETIFTLNPNETDFGVAWLTTTVIDESYLILVKKIVTDDHGHRWYEVSTVMEGMLMTGYIAPELMMDPKVKRVVLD